MLKSGWIRVAVLVPAAGFLWARGARTEGGVGPMLSYALPATLAGVAIAWIAREFAFLSFGRRTAATGAAIGFLILTPLLAILLDDNADPSNSSAVVLAISAGAAAAMGGAVWAVMRLAADAFAEWRSEKRVHLPRLTLGETRI